VQKESAFAHGKNNISGVCILNGAAHNLKFVARPKRGQHALAMDPQPQASALAQCFGSQSSSIRRDGKP
jgi:hypothetical protein